MYLGEVGVCQTSLAHAAPPLPLSAPSQEGRASLPQACPPSALAHHTCQTHRLCGGLRPPFPRPALASRGLRGWPAIGHFASLTECRRRRGPAPSRDSGTPQRLSSASKWQFRVHTETGVPFPRTSADPAVDWSSLASLLLHQEAGKPRHVRAGIGWLWRRGWAGFCHMGELFSYHVAATQEHSSGCIRGSAESLSI
uniref:protein CutA isoform X2 n=1 Tax=Callithrix jacchus TaxID=9483 RepID=UPI0023DD0A76|nr:protein CutA isoform X2 [Callithrix jacchus]